MVTRSGPFGFGLSALIAALLAIVTGYHVINSSKDTEADGIENDGWTSWDFARLLAITCAGTTAACLVWLRLYYPMWWADLVYLKKLISWGASIESKMRSGWIILDVFDEFVYSQPDHPCILYEDEVYSYAEVDARANRVARWVKDQDASLRKGDTICLLLQNSPAFAWTCLGLMKAGIIASLLNTNLKPAALIHCLKVSEAKQLIFGSALWPVVQEILPTLRELGIDVWMIKDEAQNDELKVSPDVVNMDTRKMIGDPYARDAYKMTDVALYIFTSGTTGMPKPVVVLHRKIIRATYLHFFSDLGPDDVYYIAMPMYHSAALLQGTFSVWYYGGTVAIAKKFSASRFWDDIRKHKATGFHYIGEICRYLLAQPKRDNDGVYPRPVRLAQGNGLRPEIWAEFQQRFKVGTMFEMYAATEGNFGLLNIDGKIGTVGRYPWFMKKALDTLEIVDYDYATGEPLRGPDGFCVLLKNGQTGLALNRINKHNPYTGYKGSEDMSKKKVVENVKETGDRYFNTGDLLMLDENGYAYFKDRVGDTFRWKGENVSTMEVSEVVSRFPAILEANIYGIKLPGQDGRAGMAAVVIRDGHQLSCRDLYEHTTKHLPGYACPKFIRVMSHMDVTGTFKHKKTALVNQGYDIDVIDDDMYVVDVAQKTYAPMTKEHVTMIRNGQLKF